MKDNIDEFEIDYTKPVLSDMVDLKFKHGDKIQYFISSGKMILTADIN